MRRIVSESFSTEYRALSSAEVVVIGQVGAGVEHDQRADAGDQQREQQRQAVEPEGELDPERRHPGERRGNDPAAGDDGHLGEEVDERRQWCQGQHPAGALIHPSRQRRRDEHGERDQPDAR